MTVSRPGNFSFALLVMLIVAIPWLNAAADLELRPLIYLLAVVAIAAGLTDALRNRRPLWIPISAWLLVAGGCLLVLQLVPIEAAVPAKALELRRELTGLNLGTISLDPSKTRTHLANLALVLGLFVSSCNAPWNSSRIRFLCYCLLANGTALSVFAIVQKLTWNGKLYWLIDVPRGHTVFGPFVYHNVAASYLSICFAAGMFLVITSWQSGRKRGLGLTTNRLAEGILLTVVIVGMLTSLSRGVVLSLIVSLVPVAWVLGKRGFVLGKMRWSIPILAGAVALLVWFGLAETVTERLSTLMSEGVLSNDARLRHWAISFLAARDFWSFGCGVGAYGDLVATYGQATVLKFEHAHNQYLETIVIAGVMGLCIFLGIVAAVFRESLCLISSRDELRWACGVTCLLLLLTQLIHGFVDYCTFLPGINLPLAVVVGCLFGSRRQRSPSVDSPANRFSWGVVVLLPLLLWAVSDAATAGRLAWTLRGLPWRQKLVDLPFDQLEALAEDVEVALAWRPDDAQAQEALGILRITQYRHAAKAELAHSLGFAETDPQLWNWTSLQVLHHRSHALLHSERIPLLEELRKQKLVETYLKPAMHAFRQSRNACPLLPAVHLRLEELSFIDGIEAMNGEHNRRATQLASADAALLFECGKRDFSAERNDRAFATWRDSLALSDYYLAEIQRLAGQFLTSEAFVARVLPDRLSLLMTVLQSGDQAHQNAVVERLERMLADTQADAMHAEQHHASAAIAAIQGNALAAARQLKRALQLAPERVQWRFELAKHYAALEMWKDARREALACSRASRETKFEEFLDSLPQTSDSMN